MFFLVCRKASSADTDGAYWCVGSGHDCSAHTKNVVFVFFSVYRVFAVSYFTDFFQEIMDICNSIFSQWLYIHFFPFFHDLAVGVTGQDCFPRTGAVEWRADSYICINRKGRLITSAKPPLTAASCFSPSSVSKRRTPGTMAMRSGNPGRQRSNHQGYGFL